MRKILKRLKNKRGESISEALFSVLVAALATVILVSFVTAARRASYESDKEMERFYQVQDGMEGLIMGNSTEDGFTITQTALSISVGGGTASTHYIKVLTSDQYGLTGFKR